MVNKGDTVFVPCSLYHGAQEVPGYSLGLEVEVFSVSQEEPALKSGSRSEERLGFSLELGRLERRRSRRGTVQKGKEGQ